MEVKKIRFTLPQASYDIMRKMIDGFCVNKNKLLNLIFERHRDGAGRGVKQNFNRVVQFNLNVKNNAIYEDYLIKNKIFNEAEFFRNIVSDFMNLAQHKRELLIHGEIYEALAFAAKRQVVVKIRFRGETREVEPYFVANSREEACNYLFCYSCMHGRYINYKLGNIKGVELVDRRQEHRDESYIAEVRANFDSFLSHKKFVKVRLTPEGEKQIRRASHLRPRIVKALGDGVYLYECSDAKAKVYFPQFLENAEILEPARLRDWFKKMFEAAAGNYSEK